MGQVAAIGMVVMGAIDAFSTMAEAEGQASALKEKAAYEKGVLERNVKLAETSADDVVSRGEVTAGEVYKEGKLVGGAQRAGYAAGGVEVGYGSAVDVQAESAYNVAVDAMTIRNNAKREAMGYKIQALNYHTQADFGTMAAEKAASNTLFTGGLRAFSQLGKGFYTGYRGGAFDGIDKDAKSIPGQGTINTPKRTK
jgi:hypothetical protein